MSKFSHSVLVTLDYPPERGGVARYLGNLVRASRGNISSVYVPEEHSCEGPGAVQTACFFWPGWPRWAPLLLLFRRLGKEPSGVALISQVIPVGTAAWIASYGRGPKYSILLHGLDLRLASRSRWKRWLLRQILKRAVAVFTNSTFVAKEVHKTIPAIEPVVVLPGVEPQRFPSREEARTLCHVPESCTQLLAVTRLVPRKGIDQLIASLGFLPMTTRLTVIGGGQDEERLRALARPFGDRVKFETKMEDEMRNAWYAASDIFVLPTRDEGSDVEGFGIVFLEAALAGLPVVAGQGGGVDEAVRDGETGILVDGRDSKAIAAAIQRLIDDRVLVLRLGSQGRARALKEFHWEDRWALIAKTLDL